MEALGWFIVEASLLAGGNLALLMPNLFWSLPRLACTRGTSDAAEKVAILVGRHLARGGWIYKVASRRRTNLTQLLTVQDLLLLLLDRNAGVDETSLSTKLPPTTNSPLHRSHQIWPSIDYRSAIAMSWPACFSRQTPSPSRQTLTATCLLTRLLG